MRPVPVSCAVVEVGRFIRVTCLQSKRRKVVLCLCGSLSVCVQVFVKIKEKKSVLQVPTAAVDNGRVE